jgi:flagellar biosynthetic protein FlhB
VVVAKGIDHLAARIRELAMEYNVPIVEDPLLARTLNYACEVDEPIPHELYVAVARLLAFVYSLPVEAKVLGIVHRPPKPSMEAA